MNRLRLTLPLAAALLAALLGLAAPAERTERWYEVKVAGKPAGWTRSVESRVPEGWRTESETRLRLSRGGTTLEMVTSGWIVESEDGRPIVGGRTQGGTGQVQRVTWRYESDGIVERTIDGDRVNDRRLPAPSDGALPPHAADTALEAQRRSGAAEIRQLLFDPSQGPSPQPVQLRREGPDTISVRGAPVQSTRWLLSGPMVPAGTREWRDDHGELLRSVSPTGLGAIESVLSTEERAKALLDRSGSAPELMVATSVAADRPMADPARLRSAVLRISAREGAIDVPPSTGFQRVKPVADSFEVTVDLDAPPVEATAEERIDPLFTGASPMIDARDPEIRTLAQEALADAPSDPAVRRERLRVAAWRRIARKDYGSALASASEAVRTRAGDCTEHAVLLAALLRSQGVPARVAAGLVWCDEFAGKKDVFGWHLWTQALVDGRWIDLDATLPPGGPSFHPGHVALATTALGDPAADPSWSRLVSAMGNLRIEVVHGAR